MTPDNTPMFHETNWVPGQSVSQVIHATNQTKEHALFAIEGEYTGSGDLGNALLISIKEDVPHGKTIYKQTTLSSFLSKGFIPLTTIKKKTTEHYVVTITFDPLAGNEFQGADTEFSLTMGFGLVPEKKQDRVEQAHKANDIKDTESNKQCSEVAPVNSPVVSFSSLKPNTVTLSWSAVSPVTYYVISFTRVSDGAEYGSPNVGNVTAYTIANIPGNTEYVFSVFGVNDCMPGNRGSVSDTPMGSMVLGKPEGEDKQIFMSMNPEIDTIKIDQDAKNEDLQTSGDNENKVTSGSVLGVSTANDKFLRMHLVFLLPSMCTLMVFFFWKRRKRRNEE